PGTAVFKVGTTELLLNSFSQVLFPLYISPNLCTTMSPAPNSFKFFATFLPYSIGLLNGYVKLCDTRIARLVFVLFLSLYECPFTKVRLLSYTSFATNPLGFWQKVLTLSLKGSGLPINFPSYIYLFTSSIMLSGNSYLTPISTVPGLVSILCLSHNSVSQFAPFLPTAITTLSPYMSVNSTSSFTFSDFLVLTPF